RHDALRTRFVVENFEPIQVIGDAHDWKLSVIDMSDRNQAEVDDAIDKELHFVFDLSQDILFRTAVYKQPDGAHSLVVCMHHIISDGWSISVLMNELAALYAAYSKGQPSPLHPLPIQYPDYAVWQRDYLTGEVLQRQEDYWKLQLDGVTPLELPVDKIRPATLTYSGNSIPLQLDAELTAQLKTLSKEHGVTLYMTLLTAFGVLLHKYSGQDDICVGTPIANRTMMETKNLMGFFVNTLALRANYGGDPIFSNLLQDIRTLTVDAYAHQDLPFEKVVDLVQKERDLTTSPLFQVMFVLQDIDPNSLSLSGVKVRKNTIASKTSKFDITLELVEGEEGLTGHLEYKTDLFNEATIHRLSSHFKHLLTEIVSAPSESLSNLSLLDADERHQLLDVFNDTAVDYPKNLTLHQLFEAQVARTPNHTALVFEDTALTYAELNAKANQLAHHLRSIGVGPDVQVGICVERSIEMVIGLYGILKAGGAYVPFDPDYPKDRLAFMLADCNPPVLLTQQRLLESLPASDTKTFCLDTQWPEITGHATSNPENHTVARNLAYVIFTSGSTGRPKGVGVEHAGIVNRLQWMQQAYQLTATDRVLQKTPFSFDVSVWEFFWPLLYGSTLVVAKPGGHQDAQYLAELIHAQAITTLHFVPPMLEVFLSTADTKLCSSLRQVICSGQALPIELQRRFFAQLRNVELHNLYGPTEASVDVTYWQCQENTDLHCVPIGKPIANIQIHILDTHGNPMPIGVAGELHIAGVGLARGYLNRPDLTAEKFIPNPFSSEPGARMYRSGDLARYLPDGNIEYLGRIDDQVKIRGFRIELGEIEAALAALPAVRDVVVMAREDVPGDKRLVAYIVPEQGAIDTDALRNHLAESMPSYMIPSAFISIDTLPLSVNGKVDKKRLPKPYIGSLVNTEYVAPRNAVEEGLAAIWCELLNVDRIGINHNFFDLGGHSLLAMRMVAKVRDRWQIDFPIKRAFEAQELHALAALIEQSTALEGHPIKRISREGTLPLSYAQQRLWLVNEID
ncbi:MAG: non-ribosomal peptide synthetase, partial [Burkholderiaceae bacterium]